jgi:hypothetical protein
MSVRDALWLGIVLALALLTKQSGVLLLPPALMALCLSGREVASAPEPRAAGKKGSKPGRGTRAAKESPAASSAAKESPHSREETARAREFVRNGAVLAGVLMVLSGCWFVRNHMLYGDPLGQRAFNWYFEDTPRWVSFRDSGMPFSFYLGRMVIPTTFASFWGAFGHLERPELFMGYYPPGAQPLGPLTPVLEALWPPAKYPPASWVYPFLVLATLAAAAGGLKYYLRYRAGKTPDGPPALGVGLLALHGVLVVAALLRFNVTYFQAQGRYLFPALAILAIALAGGWLEWSRRREGVAGWVIAAGMGCLAVYALLGVVIPAFGVITVPW